MHIACRIKLPEYFTSRVFLPALSVFPANICEFDQRSISNQIAGKPGGTGKCGKKLKYFYFNILK